MATLIEKLLLQVDLDVSKTEKNLVIVTQRIVDLTNKNKELKLELERLQKAEGDHSIQIENTTKAINANKAELDANKKVAQQYQAQLTQNNKAQLENTGSLQQLKAQLSLITNQWNLLSKEQRENSVEGKNLQAAAKGITDKLKEQEQSIGNARRNVGNYAGSLADAASKTGLFGNSISVMKNEVIGIREGLLALRTAIIGTTTVTAGATIGIRALGAALISTGIGALIVALGSLIAFLTQTERGSDALAKGLAFLKGALLPVKDLVIQIGEFLFKAFSNPKQALIDLVDFIKDNLINRFKAFAVIVEGIGNLDFKKINNGAIQLATGFTDVIDKAGKFGQKMLEVGQKNFELEARRDKLEDARIAATQVRANLEQQIAEKRLQASEQEDNLQKRRLLEEAKLLIEKKKNLDLGLAQEETAIAQSQFNLSEQSEASRKTLEETKAKEAEIRRAAADEERSLNRTITSVNRAEALAASKQRQEDEKNFADARIAAIIDERARALAEQEKTFQEQLKAARNNPQLTEQLTQANRIKIAAINLKFDQSDIKAKEEAAKNKLDIESRYQDAVNELEKLNAGTPEEVFIAEVNAANEAARQKLEAKRIAFEADKALLELHNKDTAQLEETFALESEAILETHLRAVADAKIKFDQEELGRQIEHQQALEDIAGNPFDKIEAQLEADKLLEEQQLANTELTEQQRDDIIARHKKFRDDLKKQEVDTALDLAKGGLEALKKIAGDNAAAGKAFATAQALINTYQAVTAALASAPPPFSFILAALQLGAGLKAVQQINTTPLPKAEHGDMYKIGGKRHTEGGTKFVGSDGTKFEAEKDELLVILNRRASGALSQLSNFNAFHGGKKFVDGGLARSYADGGIAASFATSPLFSDPTTLRLLTAIENMPAPVLTVERYEAEAAGKKQAEARATH